MLMTRPVPAQIRVRSLFLSDIHLGSRACRAERMELLRWAALSGTLPATPATAVTAGNDD